MEATPDQIAVLEKLQEIDRARLQAERKLVKLPYRDQVVELRKRKKDIVGKLEKVEALHARESRQLQRIETEDRQLSEKQQKTQEKIDGSSGDYRAVNTWTRDLQGMAKRRAALDGEMTRCMAKLSEIEAVRTRGQASMREIDKQEERLVELHRAESDRLRGEVEKCRAAGFALAARLPKDILDAYAAAVQRCGGVGLAHLEGTHCSACRVSIDPNRLLQIRRDAPLAECPSCRRLLVVGSDKR
jgi:predicted  nucleic acid-binding Zn-ribbon protein